MELQELKNSINAVNQRVADLNNQRNRNIGIRENIESQLKVAIENYKNTYGVDVSSEELIQEEYAKVKEKTESELQLLQSAISAIDSGNYTEANKLLGVQVEQSKVAEPTQSVERPDVPVEQPVQVQKEVTPVVAPPVNQPVPQPTTPVAPPVQPVSQPVAPPQAPISGVEQTIKESEKLTGANEFLAGFSQPTPPVAPPTTPVAPPVPPVSQPVPPVTPPAPQPTSPATPQASQPVAPTQPESTFNPTSFGAILGGTEFQLGQ